MKGTRGQSGFLAASFVAAFCAAALPAAGAQEGNREFADSTLAGIYELAIENDLTIAEARAQYRVGAEERKLARAGILPSVQAGYDYAEIDSERRGTFAAGSVTFGSNTDQDIDNRTWDVSLVQPLFDLQAWFTFRQGVELSKQAEATFTVAQQQLVFRSIRAYFEVLRAATNLKASRAQESALKAQLDQVKQRFDVGMVAITDVHEAQAGYDLAVALRIADEGNLGIARELLSVLTGRSHGELWVLEKEFPVVDPEPASGAEWVEFAHTNNYDIKAAQHARDAAQRGARAAASAHMPTLDLQLSYQDSNSDITQTDIDDDLTVDFPNDEAVGVVALSLTVPVFTGGFTSANRRQASARYDSQIASYEGTLRTITQETRASHIQVLSDVARSRARAQAVTSTRSALEAAEVGYDVGTRNVVDVLNAQQAFFSAVRDYENSIIDYVIDFAQLKRLAGTLSPEDVYDLNQWLEPPPDPSAAGADSQAAEMLDPNRTP